MVNYQTTKGGGQAKSRKNLPETSDPPFSISLSLSVKMELSHALVGRNSIKIILLVLWFPTEYLITTEIHDSVRRRVTHFAIIKQLVWLEDAVSSLPTLDSVALLVDPAMAVGVLDGEGTQTDIVGCLREMNGLLGGRRHLWWYPSTSTSVHTVMEISTRSWTVTPSLLPAHSYCKR